MANTDVEETANNRELTRVIARWMQIVIGPLIVACVIWIGNTLQEMHTAITRIETNMMDRFSDQGDELRDHEARLRSIERLQRP